MPPIDFLVDGSSSPIEIEVSMSGELSSDICNNDNGGGGWKNGSVSRKPKNEDKKPPPVLSMSSSSSSFNTSQQQRRDESNDGSDISKTNSNSKTAMNGAAAVQQNDSTSPSSRAMTTKTPSVLSQRDSQEKDATTAAAAASEAETAIVNTNEFSRRLVEYFVTISSVPKKTRLQRLSSVQSIVVDNVIPGQPSPALSASTRKAARLDARKAHLHGGEWDLSPGPGAVDKQQKQQQRWDHSPGVDLWDLSPGGEIKKEDENDRTNKTCGNGPPLMPNTVSTTPSARRNKFLSKKISSLSFDVNEQKNKLIKQTDSFEKKLKSSLNTEKIERQLEKLKLEKTLIKLKSMRKVGVGVGGSKGVDDHKEGEEGAIAAHCNHANNVVEAARQQHQQQQDDGIDHSISSVSTDDDDDAESIMSDMVRPSQHPTSFRKLPSIHPFPIPQTTTAHQNLPPSPPANNIHTPSPPSSPWTPAEWTPCVKGGGGGGGGKGGATENIQIGNETNHFCDREYNDDIDDCMLEPVITARFPPFDHPGQPLNPMLPQFCYPQGIDHIVPSHEYKMPRIHHFVLTDSAGGKLYGTCLTVYEEFSIGDTTTRDNGDDISVISLLSAREEDQERANIEVTMEGSPIVVRARRRSRNHTYYAPRVLCLLSTWPYLSAFRTYLTQLYRLATTTDLMNAPIERYILNICSEVPAPPPGSFEVTLSILDTQIRFWAPPADQPIPYVSLNYGVIFECLDIDNVLFVWYTLACERKILLVSSQLSLLTVCAEILCSMLFPMRWSHLYIPVLPRFLTPMLDAPMPYLCGISRDIFPNAVGDISDETVVVDLDRNLITLGTNSPDLPILSHRRKIKLESALENNAGDVFWNARGLTKSEVESVRSSGDEDALAKMLLTADGVWDEKLSSMDDAFNLAHSPDSLSMLHGDKDESQDWQKQSRWDLVQEAFLRFYVVRFVIDDISL